MELKAEPTVTTHGHGAYHILDATIETRSLIIPSPQPTPRFLSKTFASLCCCFRSSVTSTQAVSWKTRWRAIKEKYTHKKTHRDVVLATLLALPFDRTAFAELEKLNLSPNATGHAYRTDLEFYIPQLCNFMLFGEFDQEHVEDLVKFVLEACRTSFHFYHRVIWFLQSTNFDLLDAPKVNVERLTRAVEIAVRGSQRVYIGKGPELLSLCHKLDLAVFPEAGSPATASSRPRDEHKRLKAAGVIEQYKRPVTSPLSEIDPMHITLGCNFADEDNAFQDTINFVQALTAASVAINTAGDKREELIKILASINSKLPAAVYIPFTRIRNCALLHLHVDEVKLFKTKERAPFLICFEVFDPLEEYQSREVLPEGSRRNRSPSISLDRIVKSLKAVAEPEEGGEVKAENISYPIFQQIMNEASEIVTSRSESSSPRLSLNGDRRSQTFTEEGIEEEESKLPERHSEVPPPSPVSNTLMYVYDNESDEEGSPRRSILDISHNSEVPGDIFGEFSSEQESRIRALSPFRSFATWKLVRVIVKSGEDLRQEQLAIQLITQFHDIFRHAKLNLWLRPYEIIATGRECGLIECIPDAVSIDSIKKSMPAEVTSLSDFFKWHFGPPKSKFYKKACKCFVKSLAAYSLVCFVLQIKDRHNGNILLDRAGHVIHIDFGFMISNSPGGGLGFEQAPFKLTDELVDVIGGARSSLFREYRKLCTR